MLTDKEAEEIRQGAPALSRIDPVLLGKSDPLEERDVVAGFRTGIGSRPEIIVIHRRRRWDRTAGIPDPACGSPNPVQLARVGLLPTGKKPPSIPQLPQGNLLDARNTHNIGPDGALSMVNPLPSAQPAGFGGPTDHCWVPAGPVGVRPRHADPWLSGGVGHFWQASGSFLMIAAARA